MIRIMKKAAKFLIAFGTAVFVTLYAHCVLIEMGVL
jgi:hypothetical protein